MKAYIYKVLKEFAIDYKNEYNVRPGKWECVCYMSGYNPDETIGNIYKVLEVLIDEGVITYSISGDGLGH